MRWRNVCADALYASGCPECAGAWPVSADYVGWAARLVVEETDGVKEVWYDSMEFDASIEKPHMLYYLACETEALCAGTRSRPSRHRAA